jgi:hypothetical protein
MVDSCAVVKMALGVLSLVAVVENPHGLTCLSARRNLHSQMTTAARKGGYQHAANERRKHINSWQCRILPRIAGVPPFFSNKFIISWSKSLLFFIFHNFMVKINTFSAEWCSGPTGRSRTLAMTLEFLKLQDLETVSAEVL